MDRMTKQEINIRRLLRISEAMAKNDISTNWKLEKYTETLDDMIEKLNDSAFKLPKDTIGEYVKRVDFLKNIIGTSKLKDAVEKVVATQMVSTGIYSTDEYHGSNIMTQIHQKTSSKYNQELRSELFKPTGKKDQELSDSTVDTDDTSAVLKYNSKMHENIANNILLMTRSMREHATIASGIIRRDIRTLENSNKLTEGNHLNLKSESLKLGEHTKSNWRCWVWIMVAFVLIVFFNMILFMKVARKKT
ncbi:vesicle transport protein USE1 [Leptopilina heterotoma]|uniref:vesicle transport protein USE1 n=1 Tax=Leptopilina heterotoma TaxID=63436 RepID=UPI001CA974EC|nr:vesicle transport protein USE1 [Leptopilina heterotoma]XP_043464307.1 vesicle transport protein USE1 [Leptopilina heterotoma]